MQLVARRCLSRIFIICYQNEGMKFNHGSLKSLRCRIHQWLLCIWWIVCRGWQIIVCWVITNCSLMYLPVFRPWAGAVEIESCAQDNFNVQIIPWLVIMPVFGPWAVVVEIESCAWDNFNIQIIPWLVIIVKWNLVSHHFGLGLNHLRFSSIFFSFVRIIHLGMLGNYLEAIKC